MRITYQANEQFKLIVRLTDAEGNLFDPTSGPFVDIFAPSEDTSDDTTATVLNASTTSLGAVGQQGTNFIVKESTGIYSYIFPIEPDAETGTWTDRWTFTHDSVETETEFSFSVLERIRVESNSLDNNMSVRITLDSTIESDDGDALGEDVVIQFWTSLTPLYSSVEQVMIEAGGYLRNVEESTLLVSLFIASNEADNYTFADITNSSWYEFARRKFVTCLAAKMVLTNAVNNLVKRKQLADLSVEYDPTHINKIRELDDCVTQMLGVLTSGGEIAPGASLPMQTTVPGYLNADRPEFGRGWVTDPTRGGANARVLSGNRTRVRSTYKPPRKAW